MALDVATAAATCPAVGDVVLVADRAGIEALEASGIGGIRTMEDAGGGLNAAILAGAADACGPVAALLADVPCATPQALAFALAACADGPAMVSDAEGIGTTLLGAPSAADLRPRFGPRSRAAHVAAGARDVADPAPGVLSGLRRDVDSEVDLWDARRIGLGVFTRAVVART